MLREEPPRVKLPQRRCLGCDVVSHPWTWCPKCMQEKADTAMGRPIVIDQKQEAAETEEK